MKVTKSDNGMVTIDGEGAIILAPLERAWLIVDGMPLDHITATNFTIKYPVVEEVKPTSKINVPNN